MSDAFDSADKHLMQQPIISINHYSEPKDSIKKKIVNTQNFTPSDLQLFVDSIETIARLKKVKYERLQKPEVKQFQESFENSKKNITCLDPSMSFISYDEIDTTNTSISNRNKTRYYLTCVNNGANTELSNLNENCSALSNKPFLSHISSKANYSNINKNSLQLSSTQEAEESGIYLYNSQISHFYEEIHPIRPHSNVISQPKYKSLKSRFISFVKKKQRLTLEATNMISSNTFGEAEYTEIYERVLNNVSQFSKRSKHDKRHKRLVKKRRRNGSRLNKAMRFLSL